jgi:hypothetical protein
MLPGAIDAEALVELPVHGSQIAQGKKILELSECATDGEHNFWSARWVAAFMIFTGRYSHA